MSVADALRAVDEVRCTDGLHSGWRAPHSQGNAADRLPASWRARNSSICCTNAILLSKHIDEYRAVALPDLFDPPGRQRGAVTTSRSARKGSLTRRSPRSDWRAARAFASPSIARCLAVRIRKRWPSSSMRRCSSGSKASRCRPATATTTRRGRMSSSAAAPASGCSAKSSSAVACRRQRPRLVIQSFEPVPGLPGRQSVLSVHALEQADLQHLRLAAALLSAHRRGHAPSFHSLMEDTAWDQYGVGRNPRCDNCMAHCGYEGTAVDDAFAHPIKAR